MLVGIISTSIMSDFQAIIDFSFQLNKFVNIDLFQRG